MELNAEHLLKRYASMKAERSVWDSLWEDVALYVMPNRADFVTKRSKGDKSRMDKIYDSTAIHSNQILAASLHISLTSPSAPWFSIRFRQDEVNEDDSAMEWLDDCTTRMFNALSESNFNSEVNEMYLDLGAFGTSIVFLEEGSKMGTWGGLRFDTIHLSEICIAESEQGKVDTIYRKFDLPARAAVERWGDAEMPKVRESLDNNPDKKHTFLHCVHPSTDTAYRSEDSKGDVAVPDDCLLYTSPSPRDGLLSRMPSSA